VTVLVAGIYRVPLDQIEAIRPHMEAIIAATREEEGCIEYSYAPDLIEPGLFRVFEIWADHAAHQAHLEMRHMKTWVTERAKYGLYDRKITTYDIASQHEA
jgi:quinol monooxygenase YgiN